MHDDRALDLYLLLRAKASGGEWNVHFQRRSGRTGSRPYHEPVSTSLAFTVVLTPVDGGWVQAQLRELPGVVTCAPTEQEAREAVVDALSEYLSSFTAGSEEIGSGEAAGIVRVVIDAA